MNDQSDNQYLTTCEHCIHNDECPCMWSIGCPMCILIQQQIEEK